MKTLLKILSAPLLFFSTSWANHDVGSTVLSRRNSTGLTDAVTWDPQSLSIFGQRVFILSAEIHPWRLPGDPRLWSDLFQKVKANGFNTVSSYFSWALHYPTPDTNDGQGDFQVNTYRDLQLYIDSVKDAGLWLIARPGPYINGETTGGGFPGWVGNIAGSLRTDNVNYTAAWTPYLNTIASLIAKNQVTEGGPIILVQAENEFSAGGDHSPYMQAVIDTYRTNGIVVPITHNDQHSGENGNFSPDLPGPGQVNIYCGDSYPQGSNSWAQVQSVYYSFHEAVAFSNPLCLAEFGGGFLLEWGSEPLGGTGYEKYSTDLTTADYEDVFYKDAYAQTAKIFNIYMLYGGTNWGQTAAPVSYTSYDYGGGINENRVAGPKMNEMRLQGLFLRVSRDLFNAPLLGNGTNYTTSALIHTSELRNLETGAGFYFLRQQTSPSTALTTTRLTVNTSRGTLTIPQLGGEITFNGRESKILVTDYVFGANETAILYSTAEIMTWSTIDSTDYIILYAESTQTGETAFLFNSEPTVNLDDAPNTKSTFSNATLTLQYTLGGLQFATVELGSSKLVVIIMDKTTADQWNAPVVPGSSTFNNYFSVGSNETVLVGGPYVIRNASISGDTLSLTGDLNGTTAIEFIAPAAVTSLTWNGVGVSVTRSSHGTLTGSISVVNPTVNFPSLENLSWKVSGSLPEIDPNFDDSNFTLADLTQTNYTNLPPLAGSQVLYAQQYGFYGGNLIFRGRFNATGAETGVNLTVQYGFAGGYSAFLNGVFLGSSQGNSTVSLSSNVWTFPKGALKAKAENVVVVVQENMGITETSTNSGKEPRGIRGYSLIGSNTTFSSWKLQGNQGGASGTPDTFRGYLNEGGLYAERIGAHLPGFPDETWATGSPFRGLSRAGINFYRTTFDLNIPQGFDVPVRLSFTPSAITSNFRSQIYLNGWQIGKYVNNIGPQTLFVLPAGILLRNTTNTLAISLWSLDSSGASIAGLELVSDGTFATALQFEDYQGPDYEDQAGLRPQGMAQAPM
ncbi:glycoside hydrolase family 35 protein [Collybiopsis luxurians FD-317 M1]|uniref:Beta-galactosidase n=1 Tax=Collybiopsis luxurians FD-317 M1 TaxID=944289 RepID=A0A0D0CMJ1_9AGAR|nr:glycoside hydrolase family 35 protein [Collybiopsis luxurians FD-317 M1]